MKFNNKRIMKKNADYWISKLELNKHPEGGYFKEIYRSAIEIFPEGFNGRRNISTSIYYLLNEKDISSLHRLKSDEIWHFYTGSSVLQIYIIDKEGNLTMPVLGPDPESGHHLQIIIQAGCWFGAEVVSKKGYTLIGCTVSPGFDFMDFDIADRSKLTGQYPEHIEVIERLTHKI